MDFRDKRTRTINIQGKPSPLKPPEWFYHRGKRTILSKKQLFSKDTELESHFKFRILMVSNDSITQKPTTESFPPLSTRLFDFQNLVLRMNVTSLIFLVYINIFTQN